MCAYKFTKFDWNFYEISPIFYFCEYMLNIILISLFWEWNILWFLENLLFWAYLILLNSEEIWAYLFNIIEIILNENIIWNLHDIEHICFQLNFMLYVIRMCIWLKFMKNTLHIMRTCFICCNIIVTYKSYAPHLNKLDEWTLKFLKKLCFWEFC